MNSSEHQSGFSYLWMLMLVALAGIGLAQAGLAYSNLAQRERERHLLFVGKEFREAIRSYVEASGASGEYPSTIRDLLEDRRAPAVKRHLRKLYFDPLGGSTNWGLIRVDDRIVGVYSRAPGEPIKQANFERPEASFAGARKYSGWAFTYPYELPPAWSPARN